MTKHAKRLLSSVADFFAPRECVSCGKTNPKGKYSYLCPACASKLYIIRGGACLRCGEIVGLNGTPYVPSCPSCAFEKPYFNHAMSACLYGDKGSERLLFALKYNGGTYAAADLAKIVLSNNSSIDFLKGAIICPVPLHKSRLKKRKFNQSELIAENIARLSEQLGIKIARLLDRTRNTRTQTALDKAQRAENVRGAFRLAGGARAFLKNIDPKSRIVIFDDVMTTSATASECAKVLKAAGFGHTDAFSVFKRL